MSAADHLGPQFYHGSADDFSEDDLIDPRKSYDKVGPESQSGRVYFTSDPAKASFYADRAAEKKGTPARVYTVHPQGEYRQDLMTRRSPENKVSEYPLRVTGEAPYVDWKKTHYQR
jgi:Rifampin ADP-ribosyl transferase